MKKLLIILAIAMMISGCSDSEETIKKVETNAKMTVSQEVKKQDNFYKNSTYDYTIKLHDDLIKKILIEDGETTNIWYDDTTLIKNKVLIGKIEPMTIELWKEKQQSEYVMDLVKYDEANGLVYVFQHNVEPYVNYYTEDEQGEFLQPKESLEFDYLSQLFSKSLLQSDFLFGGIEVTHTIPTSIDQAGLEMSEEWYHTLQVAINDLELVLNKKDKELLADRLNSLIGEINANSPVMEQFPYPTQELGSNLIEAYEQFHWLVEPPYYEESTNQLAIENQITVINQYLQIIDQQLKQVKKR